MDAFISFAKIVQESGNDEFVIPRRPLNHFLAYAIEVVAIVSRQFQHSGALSERQPGPENFVIYDIALRPK